MSSAKGMKYIKKRGSRFHFFRRVPKAIKLIDGRDYIQLSLKTDSPSIAVERATLLNERINTYWQGLVVDPNNVEDKFQSVVNLAKLHGFNYQTASEIATLPVAQIIERILVAQSANEPSVVQAVLGGLNKPELVLSSVVDKFLVFNEDKLLHKSDNQVMKWKNPRLRAMRNFIAVVGDKLLTELTRDDVLDFKAWWVKRLRDENMVANSANKDFTHVKVMLMNISDNLRLDLPIAKLFERTMIRELEKSSRLSFEPEFVRETLLFRPQGISGQKSTLGQKNTLSIMSGMSDELWLFVCAMADTGARINELAGLEPENGDISLNSDIPFIQIRPNDTRQLKTPNSERVIPLVGASLFAFQQLPNGFEKYRHTPDTLSSTINKWFRDNDVLPSENHSLYSLRHCFQDRLTKVEAPDKVQAELMGHKFYRPKYGAGASLEQKHKWMNEIKFSI